ncbi:hypothetical protein Nocox_01700 [Nonomuraea coxensis DSM 45129]|uniref:Uncharacterized protein n=1 Tax=Nonomuraea coxensis DSM 45129 TaxID=1122611 RepID=A0ABX8TS71_9ACTN|nr:hypothetical protein Nocox_01700 [Nonomuraea coxensis DSM 45129]
MTTAHHHPALHRKPKPAHQPPAIPAASASSPPQGSPRACAEASPRPPPLLHPHLASHPPPKDGPGSRSRKHRRPLPPPKQGRQKRPPPSPALQLSGPANSRPFLPQRPAPAAEPRLRHARRAATEAVHPRHTTRTARHPPTRTHSTAPSPRSPARTRHPRHPRRRRLPDRSDPRRSHLTASVRRFLPAAHQQSGWADCPSCPCQGSRAPWWSPSAGGSSPYATAESASWQAASAADRPSRTPWASSASCSLPSSAEPQAQPAR